jgi:hypothetical protein
MLAAASALRFAGDFIAFFGALIATLGCMKQIFLAHNKQTRTKTREHLFVYCSVISEAVFC